MSSVKPPGKNRDLTHSLLLVVRINAISTILDRLLDPRENAFESKIVLQGRMGPIAGRDLANTEVCKKPSVINYISHNYTHSLEEDPHRVRSCEKHRSHTHFVFLSDLFEQQHGLEPRHDS